MAKALKEKGSESVKEKGTKAGEESNVASFSRKKRTGDREGIYQGQDKRNHF